MNGLVAVILCSFVVWVYLHERRLWLEFLETVYREFPEKKPKSTKSKGDQS